MNEAPPPRFGPLRAPVWPQDDNHVPNTPGLTMPHVGAANALRSRRESFTMAGSIAILNTALPGDTFALYLPTDPDGDFWVDQMMMLSFSNLFTQNTRPPPSTIGIADARTGRSLTYPAQISTNFLTEIHLFSDDPGHAPISPNPDGFRSTSTLAQPFCFTRAGGIQLNLTLLSTTLTDNVTVWIGFNGWKEYEAASG